MSKHKAIGMAERMKDWADSLKLELQSDTVDMQEVRDLLYSMEAELPELEKACGEIPDIGT